mgnify:CR=1 FL=1
MGRPIGTKNRRYSEKDKERTYTIFPKTDSTLNLGTYIKGTEKRNEK